MPGRRDLLETTIKARLVDTHKHLVALERAVAAFGDSFDAAEFQRAWSGEPDERLRAYPVQAGYENVINGCIRVAQELCELEGWTPPNVEPTSVEALGKLRENGVIAPRAHTALRTAYGRRNAIQHDYLGVAGREVYEGAATIVEHAPLLLQDVALYLRQPP